MLLTVLSRVGFVAATSMNCEGNVIVSVAREMVTRPSSNSWRSVSSPRVELRQLVQE